MTTFKQFLLESDEFVSHHTGFANLLSILQKDALIRGNTGFISLTKNPKMLSKSVVGLNGVGAEIIFKPSLLKTADFENYEYHNADIEVDVKNENEIRTNATALKNIKRYIKRIILRKSYFPAHPSPRDEMLMNRFMNADIDSNVEIGRAHV